MVQLVETTLRLHHQHKRKPGLPTAALGRFFTWVPSAAEHTVDAALRGASGKRGRKPSWWADATNVRVLDQSIDGDILSIVLGARRLGETTDNLLNQTCLEGMEDYVWRPSPEATALDLVATALADLQEDRQDSCHLDEGVLRTFGKIGGFISEQHGFDELLLPINQDGQCGPNLPVVRCDASCPMRAHSWMKQTPHPRSARIAGILTMVDQRTSRFALDLDDGRRVYGVFQPDDCTPLWSLGKQRVSMFGKVIYRPNGQTLRFDADKVEADVDAPTFFSRLPDPERTWSEDHRLQRTEGKGTIEGLFGALGDENQDGYDDDEAFLLAVEAVS